MSQPLRQRLRVTFSRGEALKYISHLDLARAWERALRRANVPLAYSQGYNPRPKITFAAALPVGVTGQREIMDLILNRQVMPLDLAQRLAPHLPPGLSVVEVAEVYYKLPSLQSQMRAADYRVEVAWAGEREALEARVADFLARERCLRKRRGKSYDLRPLVESLRVDQTAAGGLALHMRLRLGSRGTARHDELLDALDLSGATRAVCRQRLYFEQSI